MHVKQSYAAAFAAIGLLGVAAAIAVAYPDKKADAPAEFKLPPGWTAEDMQACVLAGTPGKMHKFLAEGVGEWTGKNTMWMGPGGDAVKSDSVTTVKSLMDGRFTQLNMNGEIPGMGPFNGFALYGFDNVSGKFVSTWVDNHSTGFTNGAGELSADGKTLTWVYAFNCPITKKPALMRQIETITGPDTKTLEMYGADPKSGKEFKMMRIELTRK